MDPIEVGHRIRAVALGPNCAWRGSLLTVAELVGFEDRITRYLPKLLGRGIDRALRFEDSWSVRFGSLAVGLDEHTAR